MNQKITNIIFCQARVPHGNLGDLILTKLLFSQLRKKGQIIVNDLDVPEWYCKELDLKDEERVTNYNMNFALMIWLYGFKALFQPNLNIYLILRPGHFYGKSPQLGNKMLLAGIYYHLLAFIQVRICRLGTSIESLSKRLEIAEKLRSNAMYFYSVRESISYEYAMKIGISKVKLFPDMAWFLQKKDPQDDLKWLMQMPNANQELPFLDNKNDNNNYVIFSFRVQYKEFDSSNYENELLKVLDNLVPLISKEWGYKILVSYQVDSDYKFSQTLRNRYESNYGVILIEDIIDSTTMYNLYSQAAIVFSNRLHVLMFSMFCGTLPIPIINQTKEQKINGIFSDAALGEVILNISQGEDIINKLPTLLEQSQSIKEKISLCFQEKQKVGEEMLQQIFN